MKSKVRLWSISEANFPLRLLPVHDEGSRSQRFLKHVHVLRSNYVVIEVQELHHFYLFTFSTLD